MRKFLRRRKAEIRRQFLSLEEAEVKVQELVKEAYRQYAGRSEQKIADAPQIAKAPEVSRAATNTKMNRKAVRGITRAKAVKAAVPGAGRSGVTRQ